MPVILPKVQVAGYGLTRMHLTYVALHEVTWFMVVWCTQNAPRRQQFYVAPAMSALYVHHFGGYSNIYIYIYTEREREREREREKQTHRENVENKTLWGS